MRLFLLLLLASTHTIHAQFTAIPDTAFEQILIFRGYDTGSPDGVVLTANIDTVTSLKVMGPAQVSDLTGIEDFFKLLIG